VDSLAQAQASDPSHSVPSWTAESTRPGHMPGLPISLHHHPESQAMQWSLPASRKANIGHLAFIEHSLHASHCAEHFSCYLPQLSQSFCSGGDHITPRFIDRDLRAQKLSEVQLRAFKSGHSGCRLQTLEYLLSHTGTEHSSIMRVSEGAARFPC
jgi:hypothetical protein